MKVIDLLNKIANGEKVPYIRYFNKKEQKELVMLTCKENIIYRLNENAIDLNDEVEILEKKKIPEKIKDKYCSQISKVELAQKYNEIIDYLKSKGE